jgi:hypothetical protein
MSHNGNWPFVHVGVILSQATVIFYFQRHTNDYEVIQAILAGEKGLEIGAFLQFAPAVETWNRVLADRPKPSQDWFASVLPLTERSSSLRAAHRTKIRQHDSFHLGSGMTLESPVAACMLPIICGNCD